MINKEPMTVKELYNKLKNHFLENGYVITLENERGMEAAHPQKGIVFDQMVEGGYIESGLHKVTNELLVQYDIFTGEYSYNIFVENFENTRLVEIWTKNLQDEVNLLKLKEFIDLNYE